MLFKFVYLIFIISPFFVGKIYPFWVYLLIIFAYIASSKSKLFILPVIFVLFFVNLHVNSLFGLSRQLKPDFNLEKINITSPISIQKVAQYYYDDVYTPYRIRHFLYSQWLTVFVWISSVLKLLSPIFWVRLMGFSGSILIFLGVIEYIKNDFSPRYWFWWFFIIIFSSGLGINLDTRNSIFLSLPILINLVILGFKSKLFISIQKYWWLLLFVDFILK
ncbi:MAG: hypothetical protein WCV93_02170 [Candidatus Shapirobacteria bacterium]